MEDYGFENVLKEYGKLDEFSELNEENFDLNFPEDIGFENMLTELTWRKEI